MGAKHLQVSEFLRQPCRIDDYIFEAADHAVIAKYMGVMLDDKSSACDLFLYAAEKAAFSASFELARKYLHEAETVLDQTLRSLYIKFLSHIAQVGAVLGLYDEVFAKVCFLLGSEQGEADS